MSLIHKNLQTHDKPEKWYLKSTSGQILGSFIISELNRMAVKGEIPPGSQVSTDSISWQPVESIQELHMDWIAELPNGQTYGPINVLAVPALHKAGYLPIDTILKNHITGKTLHLNEIIKESSISGETTETVEAVSLSANERDKVTYEQLKKQLDETLQKLQEQISERNIIETQNRHIQQKLRAEIEELTNELSTLKLHLKTSAENLADEKKRSKQLSEEASNRENQLHEQIQQLKIMVESANANANQWKEQVDTWRIKFEELTKQSEEHEHFLVEMLNQTRQDAETRVSQIASELETIKQELVSQQQLRVQTEGQYNEILEQFQDELAVLRKEKKLAEKETATTKQHLLEFETLTQELKRQIESLNEQLVQRTDELNRANTSITTLNQQNEALRNEIAQNRTNYQQQLDQMYAKEIELTNKLEHLQTENVSLLTSLDNEKSITETLQTQLATVTSQLEAIKKESSSSQASNLELQKKYAVKESALKKELEAKRLVEISANKKIESLIAEKKLLESELGRANQALENLQNQFSSIQTAHTMVVQQASESSLKEKELEEKCKKYEIRIKAMVEHEQVLSDKIKHLESDRDEAISRLNTISEQSKLESTHYINLGRIFIEHVTRLDNEVSKFNQLFVTFKEQHQKLLTQLSRTNEPAPYSVTAELQSESKISELMDEIARLKTALGKKEKLEYLSTPLLEIKEGFHSTLRRYHFLTMTGTVVCCFLVMAMLWLRIKSNTPLSELPNQKIHQAILPKVEKQEASQAKGDVVSTTPQISVASSSLDSSESETVDTSPVSIINPLASLSIHGAKVFQTPTGCFIIFEQGLFSSLTNISVEGIEVLDNACSAIRLFLTKYFLQIEGYTDSVPLSNKASFRDNQELALARAQVVLRLLAERYHFDIDSMKAVAGNLQLPPFSNDEPISRRKNRTVILKLIKREQESRINK